MKEKRESQLFSNLFPRALGELQKEEKGGRRVVHLSGA